MNQYITCLFSLSIKPEEMDAFKALIAQIVAATKEEPNTLIYEYSINEEGNIVHICERYNIDGVVGHIDDTFGPFGARFLEFATVNSLTVYGMPTAEIRKRLDAFGAVYMTPFDGFSR
ncbi:putative quinol monooxygenase [Acinetobacter sp. ANC 4636]|uniref:putative quinol monooxygenase n=1 Tax=Acinetobacter sp. ANC 4635 TaxID=2529846 RepID=UPI00103DF626|nr:hypothetical protein [Acinetobacter sp. ANC 4635]TCB26288.1 hypothetical protein E0H86_13785 [Acinetobacter sp. ANC 4635]